MDASAEDAHRPLPDLGPIQILTIGFPGNRFRGEILPELERLKKAGIVRLVDLLVVRKDTTGAIATLTSTDLEWEEALDFGAKVGELIGWGAAGPEGAELGALAGAADTAGGHVLDEEDVHAIATAIPPGMSAAVALIEHVWSGPLRDAIARAGGVELDNEWMRADDLVRLGLSLARVEGDDEDAG